MPDQLPTIIALLVKILVILGLGVYAIFAWVIVRQEQLMAKVLEESFEPILRTLAYLHLIASLGVLLLAIIVL